MKKLLLLLVGMTSLCFATAPTVSSPTIQVISHGYALVGGTTNVSPYYVYLKYGTADPPTNYSANKIVQHTNTAASQAVTGLKPSTLYYFQVCAGNVSFEESCSSTVSGTTSALPSDRYSRPTEPTITAIPDYPASFTATYTVNTTNNCNGTAVSGAGASWTGGLQECIDHASALAGAGNYRIAIPAGARCYNTTIFSPYYLRARSGGGTGWIVLDTDDTSLYPPTGVRTAGWWPVDSLATVSAYDTNGTLGGAFNIRGSAKKYRITGLKITNEIRTDAYKTVTSYSGGTVTVPSHGWATNTIVQFRGNTGEYLYNAKITNTGTNTFTIQYNGLSSGTIAAGWKVTNDPTEFMCLVCTDTIAGGQEDIIFDRNYFVGDLVPMGYRYGIQEGGTRWWIHDNTFHDIQSWCGFDTARTSAAVPMMRADVCSTSEAIDASGGQNISVVNNYFDSPGITYFAQGGGGSSVADHHLLKRNSFIWDLKYWLRSPTFRGLDADFRQPIEQKNGSYWWYTGNIFKNIYNINYTGNYVASILVTPKASDGAANPTTTNKTQNLIIENNTFQDVSGVVTIVGGDPEYYSPQVDVTKSILFRNNLAFNIKGYELSLSGAAVRASLIYVGPFQDMLVEHNTMIATEGDGGGFWTHVYGSHRWSGLKIRNNIFGIVGSDASWNVLWDANYQMIPAKITGSPWDVMQEMGQTVPSSTSTTDFKHNYLVPTSEMSVASPAESLAGAGAASCVTNWETLLSETTNICRTGATIGARLDALNFYDRSSRYDFRLIHTSPIISGAKLSDDGQDMGVGYEELYAAQGRLLSKPKLVRGASTTKLRYRSSLASERGIVEVSSSSTFGSGTRTVHTPGTKIRDITVDLSPGQNVRFYIGTQQYVCPYTGGTCVLQ